ncbi:hypothetical protein QTP81_04435 [Alteromonas sp. ASW11-36]|uniref:DUF2846 domain-containing protein n=1 Tax=Alteromonas arenosi TaxID=3055817 RepID=A0ABT7SWA4_9ALTE|nr:hypothetical protein [Alteromonas sp. ASW11-36]MDM7859847.1 hypothetical protein [Alteromonas sp. ASW11-36]
MQRRNFTSIVFCSLLALGLAGCNSTAEFDNNTLGKVLNYQQQTALFVYSDHDVTAESVLPLMRVNGQDIHLVTTGSVTVVPLQPGVHKVSLHSKETPFDYRDDAFYAAEIEVKQGQQLYFRWQEDNQMFVTFERPMLTRGDYNYGFVTADVAMTDIENGRFSKFTVSELVEVQ